ncbi:MAG: PorV/PorQ family protein [Bacteroidetes bacterium]|nr:PorV/PorQ family protein [Bacteroidota bacterium]
MKKLIILLFLIFNISHSQLFRSTTKVGTTAAQFLKIGSGARAIAMGSSSVAVEGDVYSLYWNPSLIVNNQTTGSSAFTHAEWIADVNYDYAASILNLENIGIIGFSFTSLSTPEDIVRTENNPFGDGRKWKAQSLALGITYARLLTDKFAIGGTLKYINESIWNEKATGYAFDIGTIYRTDWNDLRIGSSISNFGTKLKLNGSDLNYSNEPGNIVNQGPQNVNSLYQTDEFDIPLLFRVGLAIDYLEVENLKATLAIDAIHPNDNKEYLNVGTEISYDKMFFGRVGFKSLLLDESEESLTWGIGINYPLSSVIYISLDYAFADFGRLKNVHYISLTTTY